MTEDRGIDTEELVALRHGDAAAQARLKTLAANTPKVAKHLTDWDRQDTALRCLYNPVAEEPLPARFQAALEPRPWRFYARPIAAALAIFTFGAGTGWFAATAPGHSNISIASVDAALRAHATYVVEVRHPVEVSASEEAHLVGWLSRRVGAEISPPDLSVAGFELMGGRIVPDERGTAALMMYEDDIGRRVTLYFTPAPGDRETGFRFIEGAGAQGFWWVDETLGYALVGDLPRDLLRAIATSVYKQLTEI